MSKFALSKTSVKLFNFQILSRPPKWQIFSLSKLSKSAGTLNNSYTELHMTSFQHLSFTAFSAMHSEYTKTKGRKNKGACQLSWQSWPSFSSIKYQQKHHFFLSLLLIFCLCLSWYTAHEFLSKNAVYHSWGLWWIFITIGVYLHACHPSTFRRVSCTISGFWDLYSYTH